MSAGRTLSAAVLLAALAAAPAPAQGTPDTAPPDLRLDQPPAGTTFWQMPRPYFSGEVSDDVTAQPGVTLTIREKGADPADEPAVHSDLGPRSGFWNWSLTSTGSPALTHGVVYEVVVVARDEAGNTDTEEADFKVDGVAPWLKVGAPAGSETTDSTPVVSGTASLDEGDLPFVNVVLLRPEGSGQLGVASVAPDVAADASWSGELSPAVPPGDYTLRLTRLDRAMNAVVIQRPLRVLPAPEPAQAAPEPPAPEPVPPFTTPSAGTATTPLTAATRLQRAAVRALRRTAIRRLLRRGARVSVATGRAGTASIDLLHGGSAARSAAPRVLARGRRAVDASGRGTISVRATAAGRKALRRSRRARLTVRVRFEPVDDRPVTLTAPLTLRR